MLAASFTVARAKDPLIKDPGSKLDQKFTDYIFLFYFLAFRSYGLT
jgi:hypothetical protein